MFLCYGVGLFFFISKVPECLAPGRFDVISSHFIWHALIVAALVSFDSSMHATLSRDWHCSTED
jgi:predicted membrane channel-forming protein YqfA (hemolysin III family)